MESILKFFQSDFKLINNLDSQSVANSYHLPCLISDDTDFIPCDNIERILMCFNAISKMQPEISRVHDEVIYVNSVQSYSEVFFTVDCKAELRNEYDITIQSINFQCYVMKNGSTYKIVVMHFNNYNLPDSLNNKLNKKSELQKISSKKMRKDINRFFDDVANY